MRDEGPVCTFWHWSRVHVRRLRVRARVHPFTFIPVPEDCRQRVPKEEGELGMEGRHVYLSFSFVPRALKVETLP